MITGRNEKISNAAFVSMVFQVWKRNFLEFQRNWKISFVWIVVEPLLTLGAMGFGLGAFVPTIGGISYVDFFFPALICISSMFVSFFVSTYDNFSKLSHQRLFHTQILSPIEPREIVIGEIFWAATKGTFSAIGVSAIAAVFGLVYTWKIFLVLPLVFLSSLVFAAFGMLVTTWVKNFDQIIYPASGLIIPISLFSGTYFPIDQLPFGLQYLTYLSPLTHAVRAARTMLLRDLDWILVINFGVLFVMATVLIHLSVKALSRRLLD